ncbi:hypothetical protein [Viridibacillus arvi]|uniref:hypothetical protein n=1 Tax=Viridibacillus arvi TaxID=263475 RepID=UPI0034CDA5D0
MLNQLREEYKRLYSKRHNLLQLLTERERKIFIKISNELRLNQKNIPGFFFIEFPHSHILKTPSFVWQLWLYHRFIHFQTSKQAKDYTNLTLVHVYGDICELIDSNYFRLNSGCEKQQLKHLITECINEYTKIGVLVDKNNNSLKEIRYDHIPLFDMNDNIFVEIFYNFILPKFNYQFDFQNEAIPRDIKKSVYLFQNKWLNTNNGYVIQDQFKFSNQQQCESDTQVIIYADQKALEKALTFLTPEQKKSIAMYLKSDTRYSTNEICELLIRDFNLNNKKDDNGLYQIYKYIDEYIFSSLWLWN